VTSDAEWAERHRQHTASVAERTARPGDQSMEEHELPEWEPVPESESQSHTLTVEGQAAVFLKGCGLEPTQDAIEQLAFAFLPALEIMCQRGTSRQYNPDGKLWQKAGWRPQLMQLFKQVDRLHWKAWKNDMPADNETLDAMNFLGFFHRGRQMGLPRWGEHWGEPGE
jgi:hypothetical protein